MGDASWVSGAVLLRNTNILDIRRVIYIPERISTAILLFDLFEMSNIGYLYIGAV